MKPVLTGREYGTMIGGNRYELPDHVAGPLLQKGYITRYIAPVVSYEIQAFIPAPASYSLIQTKEADRQSFIPNSDDAELEPSDDHGDLPHDARQGSLLEGNAEIVPQPDLPGGATPDVDPVGVSAGPAKHRRGRNS